MVRGIEKRRIFDDETDRRNFVRRLGALAEETGTPVYAWALLSNHVHVLLCSGALGLTKFMRRLLTGYAVSYNLRHRRHGHVFQNRYKSIVCDGDSYFTELVRYIHLNPLRVELVKDLKELEKYPYCGHGTILGTPARQWQDCETVLAQFGRRASDAKEAYRKFVAEGVRLGRRPELVGGGLARSSGEWFAVRSQRPRKAHFTCASAKSQLMGDPTLHLEEKLAGQKQVKALESQRNAKRRALFHAQDDIDRRREQLIADIEGKLQQRVSHEKLFSIRWKLA